MMSRRRPDRIIEPAPLEAEHTLAERIDYMEYIRAVRERARRLRAHREILDPAEKALSSKQVARLRSCGEAFVEVERLQADGTFQRVWRQLHCGSRYCPICASREAYKKAEELSERFERHGHDHVQVLATITIGRPVKASGLRARYSDLRAVWKALWPVLKANGCVGGNYAYEMTASGRDPDSIHLHMHVWLDFMADARWLVKDTNYVVQRARHTSSFTPAWLQYMAWVEQAIEKAAGHLWERLPLIEDTWKKGDRLGHARKVASQSGVDLPRRWVSVDFGGRFPGRPGTRARKEGRWVPLFMVASGPKEALKYLLKGMEGESVEVAMRLFQGRRRVQPFGVYCRSERVRTVAEEVADLSGGTSVDVRRLTGLVLAFGGTAQERMNMERLIENHQAWGMSQHTGMLARDVRLRIVHAGPDYTVWRWVDKRGRAIDIPFNAGG